MASQPPPAREIAAVLRVVSNLGIEIENIRAVRYYSTETVFFLEYAARVLSEITAFLTPYTAPRVALTPFRLSALKRDLAVTKSFLLIFHDYIKHALDADTLNTPQPLPRVLNAVAKTVDPEVQVMVSATEAFNYLQHPIGELAKIDPGRIFSRFPRTLGVVSFPFSEKRSALTNVLLFHELGHFFFKYRKTYLELAEIKAGAFKANFHAALKVQFPEDYSEEDPGKWTPLEDQAWLLLLRWAEELYCDLFACRTTGPSFLFAYWGILSALPSFPMKGRVFSRDHPADLYRLGLMQSFLASRRLYDLVSSKTPEVDAALEACGAKRVVPHGEWVIGLECGLPEPLARVALDTLLTSVRPAIIAAVDALPAECAFDRKNFDTYDKHVRKCLSELVVPSEADRRCVTKGIASAGELRPTTVLLSAFIFFLLDYPDWRKRFPKDHGRDMPFYDRLSDLTLKAMEDLLLVKARKAS